MNLPALLSKTAIIGLTGISALPANPSRQEIKKDPRPNIIFILTDDQRWDALGYAGNKIISTPEMDKLAAEGCYFKNAFVTTPICAASRASIMTGTWERKHGYTFGQPPMTNQQIDSSYFAVLKASGYYNGFLGKFGVLFNEERDTSLFNVYQPETTNFYWRLTGEGTTHTHLTDLMGERAVDFIENAPHDKPFCLSVSYNAPHAEDRSPEQYIWPKDFDTLYETARIPDPALGDETYFSRLPVEVRQGFNFTRWLWRFDTPEKYQHMVKGYYRMISGIDRTIGHIRAALRETGVDDNTVIILMGDNGYFLGERQLAGKWLMYENSLRVPLIVFDPRSAKHYDFEDLALNVDIAPTILDFAKAEIPGTMQGKSLAGYVKGEKTVSDRDAFLCEHLWKFKPIPASEGIRTKQWKYFRYIGHPELEELYDLQQDPLETRNLAGEKKFSKIRSSLEKELNALITEESK